MAAWLADGENVRGIARATGLTEGAIYWHLKQIYRQVDLTTMSPTPPILAVTGSGSLVYKWSSGAGKTEIPDKGKVLMNRLGWIFVGVFIFVTVAPSVAQEEPFKLLATNSTGTMEEELNEAGAAGYRVVGMQGGGTGFGGNQVVVIMALDPEGRRFRYVLLATSRTGTLESELNELPPGFSFVGMTVFNSRFGGDETAAILEAVITE